MASPLFAAEQKLPEIPTGLEWLQAAGKDRQEGLLASMLTVRASGVDLQGDFLEYDAGVRRHLLRHPELQAIPLTNVVADYAYENFPELRADLDKLRVSGKTRG